MVLKFYSFRITPQKIGFFCFGVLCFCLLFFIHVSVPSTQAFCPEIGPVCRVDTGGEKKLAVTFETLGEGDTDTILRILENHHACATFFLEGKWALQHPEETKKIALAGHEIGSHSQTHPRSLWNADTEQIQKELWESCFTIQSLIGCSPSLFRPPYGLWSTELIAQGRSLGLETILWDVDVLDWKNCTPKEIKSLVLQESGPGSILRFQNAAINTASALDIVLEDLEEQGYQMVTVSELLAEK